MSDANPSRFGEGLLALVVDDEPVIVEVLSELLEGLGFEVRQGVDVATGNRIVEEESIDLLLVDKNLPDGVGLDIAKTLLSKNNEAGVMVVTGYPSLDAAVESMRIGAFDFLSKPLPNLDVFAIRMRSMVDRMAILRKNRELVQSLVEANKELEARSVRDGLTGLFNHAYFWQYLEVELARTRRSKRAFSLVYFDIDQFKMLNDQHGHLFGDSVLKGIGDILSGESRKTDVCFRLREQDIAARYGGDEFGILLPETDVSGAGVVANRLRETIASTEFRGTDVKVTVSVGVATCPADGEIAEAIVEAADVALYAAKASGRNAVFLYHPSLGRGS